MRILAFDLGTPKTRSRYALLDQQTPEKLVEGSCPTDAVSLARVIKEQQPDRVVIEAINGVGWVVDLLRSLEQPFELQVANPRDEAFRNRRSKTDRRDAVLLLKLSLGEQLRLVHVPAAPVRGWREAISARSSQVRARTRVKNHLRGILRRMGLRRAKLWSKEGLAWLREQSRPLAEVSSAEAWRGLLHEELAALAEVQARIERLEEWLDALQQDDARTQLLQQELPCIGPRTSEAIVAWIDQPLRFSNQKQAGAYFGLCPRVHQSGETLRHGGITKAGPPLVRWLLTEVVRVGYRQSAEIRQRVQTVMHGSAQREHQAIVAVARWLLVRAWAKLRDQAKQATTPPPALPALATTGS